METENYLDLPLDDFLGRLAAGEQAPGGGSAAALTVAAAGSLVAMVARSSRHSWKEAGGVLAQATALVDRIAPLVRADAEVWQQAVAALHTVERGDVERDDDLERTLDAAAAVPIEIAGAGADAAALAAFAADRGEGAFRADAAVAAVLAAAGARAASHLVEINLGVRKGDERLQHVQKCVDAAAESAARALDAAR